jgi:hypothetical protein
MDAPWTEALAAYEAMNGAAPSALRLAAEGHPNARHIVANELKSVTGCTCGADDLCAPEIDTPVRARLRIALQALQVRIGAPVSVETIAGGIVGHVG